MQGFGGGGAEDCYLELLDARILVVGNKLQCLL